MKINITNVLNSMTKAAEETANFSDGYKLVYPQDGELKVKLLFNPPTQVVMRLVNRHMINDDRVACMSQYGKPCPICSVVNKIEQLNPNMEDLWKLKNNRRAIMFAEYLSSSYSVSTDTRYQPQKGEVIMLMVPYTVYADISQILSKAGNNIVNYISENKGKVISITRYRDKGRVQYSVEEDTLIGLHATRKSDEEFDELLMSLPSLNEKIVPEHCSKEIEEKNERLANILEVEYIGRHASDYQRDSNTNFDRKFNQQSSSNSKSSNTQAEESETTIIDGKKYAKINGKWTLVPNENESSDDNPKCFGDYKEDDPKCDICPKAWDCQDA